MIKNVIKFIILFVCIIISYITYWKEIVKINNEKIEKCLKNGGQAVMKDKIKMEYCIEKKYCDFDPLAKYN